MKIAFTICSNNYLAQAKVLMDSMSETNPEYKLYIFLCDEFNERINYKDFGSVTFVSISNMYIYCFHEIVNKYDIVELNTSIKPSAFKYLIANSESVTKIIYLDPDIQVFDSLDLIEDNLENHDILLTPHVVKPIAVDDKSPAENLFLNYGIYNLGFLAVKADSPNVANFLDWWEERTLKIGYSKVEEGLFVDQLWINLVPIFFDKVKILKELGLNVAPWNLHERNSITKVGDKFIMIDNSILLFYHFSSYNYKQPEFLSKYYNRYDTVVLSQEVKTLYNEYHKRLVNNNVSYFHALKCFYNKEIVLQSTKKQNLLKRTIISFLPPVVLKAYRKIAF